MKLIAKALLETQKNIENATKSGENPAFKRDGRATRYATLEDVLYAVKGVANNNGIAIVQAGDKDENGHFLRTQLIHESGETIESKVYLVLDKQTMQGLGSAWSYARRYALTAIFGIGTEDDDGNQAEKEAPKTEQQSAAKQPQTTQQPKTLPKSNGFKPRGATQ